MYNWVVYLYIFSNRSPIIELRIGLCSICSCVYYLTFSWKPVQCDHYCCYSSLSRICKLYYEYLCTEPFEVPIIAQLLQQNLVKCLQSNWTQQTKGLSQTFWSAFQTVTHNHDWSAEEHPDHYSLESTGRSFNGSNPWNRHIASEDARMNCGYHAALNTSTTSWDVLATHLSCFYIKVYW